MMGVREQIRKFRTGIDDWNMAQSIFEAASMPEIFLTLSAMLEEDLQYGNNESEFYIAIDFIQDVGLSAPNAIKRPFRRYFTRSRLLKRMRALLFSDKRTVRERVRYALDKLTLKSNGIYFEKALYQFYESDPLWTDGLLFGLAWIRHGLNLDVIMRHPHYLVRWPVLHRHEHIHDPNNIVRKKQELDFYLHDENRWIRAEAEHICREMIFDEEEPMMTEQESEQRRKEIDKLMPKVEWWLISLKFENFLSAAMRDSYTLEELDAFVQDLAKENGPLS